MDLPNTEQLNLEHAFRREHHSVQFQTGKGGLPLVNIQNEQANAVISMQGAYVLSWVPAGEDEVIWVSEDATFASGKSIRGGIPICWPWFGAHETNPAFPAHGFARTVFWQVSKAEPLATGETQITFILYTQQLDSNKRDMWPQPTLLQYKITIGRTLTLELTTFNRSKQPITVGQALHTYFAVDNVSSTTVYGLEDRDYFDKADNFILKTQTGPIKINSETDRVYQNTPDDITIDDGRRKIFIHKQGSRSTVVWNPWETVAARMGDLGKNGYLKMLCVETANAADDVVTIAPGENHTLWVRYEVGH
jgi:glucose-6-phosphate 1-epimerase